MSQVESVGHPVYEKALLNVANIDFRGANDLFERVKRLGTDEITFSWECLKREIDIQVSCFHFAATARVIWSLHMFRDFVLWMVDGGERGKGGRLSHSLKFSAFPISVLLNGVGLLYCFNCVIPWIFAYS